MNDLDQILARSRAADSFKVAVRRYCTGRGGDDPIQVEGFAPPIKVRRVLVHMLATEAHLPIERVVLRGRSGCSNFVGTVDVETSTGTHVYEFVWDCRWRAEQEGWAARYRWRF